MRIAQLTLSVCFIAASLHAQAGPVYPPTGSDAGAILHRAIANDNRLRHWMESYEPLVETYVRNVGTPSKVNDLYFLGRLDLHREFHLGGGYSFDQKVLFGRSGKHRRLYSPIGIPIRFTAQGFSAMLFPFTDDADETLYSATAAGTETVAGVPCVVYDVVPRPADSTGMFSGRLWIDPSSAAIVRFRGAFGEHWSPSYTYLHFDGWRSPVGHGFWIPATIIVSEVDPATAPKLYGLRFEAMTRVWDYRLKLRQYVPDPPPLELRSEAVGATDPPLLREMEKEGLLARAGDVEQQLDAIVARLLSPQKEHAQISCRVLLTMPVESFSLGHTIVVSRGMLELLPPGDLLAPVLAHEAAHIVLGQTDFPSRTSTVGLFDRPEKFHPLNVAHSAADERKAEQLAQKLLLDAGFAVSTARWTYTLQANATFGEFLHPRFGIGWQPPTGVAARNPGNENNVTLRIPQRWVIQSWTNQLSDSMLSFSGAPSGSTVSAVTREGDKR